MDKKVNEAGFLSYQFKTIFYVLLIIGLILGLSGGVSACLMGPGGGLYGDPALCAGGNILGDGPGLYLHDGSPTCTGLGVVQPDCIVVPLGVPGIVIDCNFNALVGPLVSGVGFYTSGISDALGPVADLTVMNCEIFGFPRDGIFLTGSDTINISNNLIHDNGVDGIEFVSVSNCLIEDNLILANFNDGIYFDTVFNCQITNNTINNNINSGIELFSSTPIFIDNNFIENNTNDGVYGDGASDVLAPFTGNRICSNGDGATSFDINGCRAIDATGINTCDTSPTYQELGAPPGQVCTFTCAFVPGASSQILIVDDNDGLFASGDSSAMDFFNALNPNPCFNVVMWLENVSGHPNLTYLQSFDVVIWTTGDYWRYAVDAADDALLRQYVQSGTARLILEGGDIGHDHRRVKP